MAIPKISGETRKIMKDLLEKLDKMYPHLRMILDCRTKLEDIKELVRKIDDIDDMDDDVFAYFGPDCGDVERDTQRIALTVAKELYFAYYILTRLPFCTELLFAVPEIGSPLVKTFSVFEVRAEVLEHSTLVVQLPPVMSRQPYRKAHKGRPMAEDYAGWFKPELERALEKIRPHLPRLQRRHFSVFRAIPSQIGTCPDNDNVDVKVLIDTITAYLGGTDNPWMASYSSTATVTSELQEGCYIIVTGDYNAPPDEEFLTEAVRKAFPGDKKIVLAD